MGRTAYKTNHLKPYEVQQLLTKMSGLKVAKIYGLQRNAFYKWCSKQNIIVQRITDYELKEEIKVKTPKEIAFEYGYTLNTVYKRLKKLGLNKKALKGGLQWNGLEVLNQSNS